MGFSRRGALFDHGKPPWKVVHHFRNTRVREMGIGLLREMGKRWARDMKVARDSFDGNDEPSTVWRLPMIIRS